MARVSAQIGVSLSSKGKGTDLYSSHRLMALNPWNALINSVLQWWCLVGGGFLPLEEKC